MKANFESLYEHVGYLFYALACEQRDLSDYDLARLEREIVEALPPIANVEPTLHYTLLRKMIDAIGQSQKESLTSNNAFELFEDYYFVHHGNFGPMFQDKIVCAANAISHEFFSVIKSPAGSCMLIELKQLFYPTTAAAWRDSTRHEYQSVA
jgi:hypothetical protein